MSGLPHDHQATPTGTGRGVNVTSTREDPNKRRAVEPRSERRGLSWPANDPTCAPALPARTKATT